MIASSAPQGFGQPDHLATNSLNTTNDKRKPWCLQQQSPSPKRSMQPERAREEYKVASGGGSPSPFPHRQPGRRGAMAAPGLSGDQAPTQAELNCSSSSADMAASSSSSGGGMICPGDGGAGSSSVDGSLIPGLRDDALALQCLARVPRASHPALKAVCRGWRRAMASRELYQLRHDLGLQEHWIYISFCRRFPDFVPAPPAALGNGNSNGNGHCIPPQIPPWMRNVWLTAYDPRFNVWHPIGALPGLRDGEILKGFGFVSIDERLYVIGGRLCTKHVEGETLMEVVASHSETDLDVRKEVFSLDCTTGEWTQCASMTTPRVDFACTVAGGRIYVAGGRCHAGIEKGVASAEVYCPAQDRWEPLPSMTTGRYKCVGVTVDDKVHVIGGFTGPEDSDTVNVFTIERSSVDVWSPPRWDVVRGMWQLDIPPNQILSLEGKLYSSGDLLQLWKGSIETYDEVVNMWKAVAGSRRRMREKEELQGGVRCYLTMAAIGRKLYFVGGYRIPSHPPKCLDTIDVFDLDAPDDIGKWSCMQPVQSPCFQAKDVCSHCCVVGV